MGATTNVFQELSRGIGKTITVYLDKKIQFRDTGLYIYSSADGQLDIVADTALTLAATTITTTGAWTNTGDFTVTGDLTVTGDFSFGDAYTDTMTVAGDIVYGASTAAYLIDMNAATPSTADMRLSNGATISNASANALTITEVGITLSGATTLSGTAGTTQLAVQAGMVAGYGINITNSSQTLTGGFYGIQIHMTGIVHGDQRMHGVQINMPVTSNIYTSCYRTTSAQTAGEIFWTDTRQTSGEIFYAAWGAATTLAGTMKGIVLDMATNVTIGTQSMTGLEITMPATYGSGTEYGIYVSGDGVTVAICNDGAAGITIGGTVTTDITFSSGATAKCTTNTLTIEEATITLTGGTAINLDGATTVTGILTIDTASSPADGIKISATTPTDGLEISSACGSHAINISAAQTGAGITIASTCGTYGLNIAGVCTTAAINIAAPTTVGILMAGDAAYNPIQIGSKSNTSTGGLNMVGVTDDTGGVMIFADDNGAAIASITSPIWTRYLITKTDQSSGSTAAGAFFQMKTLTGMTMNTGSYTATKVYQQIGGTLVLTNGGECAIINAGLTMEGAVTNTSGRFSGIDVNINTAANTITDTIGDSAGIHIRKTSGSTYGWPVGLKINDAGSITGISIGTCTTGIQTSGTYTAATGRAAKFAGTVNLPAYGDGYGWVESELSVTGQSAGHTSALTSWINFGATSITGAHYHCAQSNGLYSDASATLTNGLFVFGMRMQCLLQDNGGVSGATFFPFSIVNNTNVTTALFHVNGPSSDIGLDTDAGADTGTLVPLYYHGSTKYYVKIYTHT